MSTLVVLEYVSLDGVIQAPGYAGEDDSAGGFEHGGWTGPLMATTGGPSLVRSAPADAFVFGRLTCDIFAAVWPRMTSPDDEIASALNRRQPPTPIVVLPPARRIRDRVMGTGVSPDDEPDSD